MKKGKIIFLYIFIFVMCMGASFAWYAWKGSEVNVNVNFAGLDPYIKYTPLTIKESDKNKTLTESNDYTGGIGYNLTFNKNANGDNLDAYGQNYLKVTSATDSDIFKASNLKWTLVSVSNNTREEISTGNFVGENVVEGNDTSKMIPISIDFSLTKESQNTNYEFYLWLDSNSHQNVDISGKNITVSMASNASTIKDVDEMYIRSIEYEVGVIKKFTAYSSKYDITGYKITNTETTPSSDDSNWIAISSDNSTIEAATIESGKIVTIEPNKTMDTINNICIKNSNNEVYCKSIGKYSDEIDRPTGTLCNNLTYNGNSQQLVSSTSGVGYTLNNYMGTNAEKYTITATLKDNYIWKDGTSTPATFDCNISKKDLIVKAKDQTINYGEPISQELNMITSTGLVEKDSITSIILTPSTTEVTNNGTITPEVSAIFNNDGDDTMGNYDITYETGKLTINKLSATCPTIEGYSGKYDGNSHTITVTGGSGGTIKYRTSTTGDWSTTKPTRTEVGTTTVYVEVEGDTNHTTTDCGNKTITIGKRALTITASAQTVNYGSSIATGVDKVTTSGLVNGHVLTSITLNASTTNVTTSGTITPSGAKVQVTNTSGANVTTNYNITYKTGTLTIKKVAATCPTLTAYSDTYDDKSHTITVSGGSGGTIKYRTSTTGDWSTTKPTRTEVGTTTVYVEVEGDTNHTTTDCGNKTITIGKRALTITASAQTVNYGSSIATGVDKVTTSGLVNGHVLTSITLNASTTNVTTSGTITPSGAKVQVTNTSGANVTTNYNITYKTGTLTINKINPTLTVSATSLSLTYGTNQTFTYTYNGDGEVKCISSNTSYATCSISGNTVTVIPKSVTSSAITIGLYATEGTNYKALGTSSSPNKKVSITVKGITYKATFNKGSGVSAIGSSSLTCTTTGSNTSCSVTAPTITSNTGYGTGKWGTSSSTQGSISAGSSITLSSNATYYAIAKANTYTITYYGNGGSSAQYGTSWSNTATYDSTYTIESNWYTRTGYTFAGWTTISDGTDAGTQDDKYGWTGWSGTWKYDNGQYGISNNTLKLYARWTINYYTLTIKGYDSVNMGYYKINGASSYTSFSAFANTITLSVKYGSTYYYYGTPADDTVYMAKCSQSSPCSGKMGASDATVELVGNSKSNNTLSVSARSLTYNGSAQSLVTASSAQGTVYYAVGTRLTSSNYSSSGSTTIPTRTNAGSYTVYYYTPGNTYYLSKSGSVNVKINSKYPSLNITLNPNSASSSFSINSSSASYKCNSSGCSSCSGTTCTTFSSSDWINSMSFSWTNTGYSTGTNFAWNYGQNYTGSFSSSIDGSTNYTATTNTRAINTGGKRMVKITNNGTSASGSLTTTVYIYFAINGDGYINGSLADGWFTENDYYYYRKNGNKLTGSTASGKVSAFWLNYDSSAQYYSFDTSGRNVYAWLSSSYSQYVGYSKMAAAISTYNYGDTANTMYYGTKQPIYFTNGSVKNTTGSSSSRLMGLVISPTTTVYYPNNIYSACTNIAFSSISSTYYSCWYDKTGENDTEYTCE